ncbi:MAG TPA: ATP-binding protein, partial [Ktedonobacterales bacterium]
YASGSLSRLFAEPTNVTLSRRLVVFDVRDMDAELRPLVLYLIAEFVWTRVRRERRPRLLIMDEAWTLMQYTEGGRFLASLARRARKYYLGLVTITQDAQDFLSSEQGRTVLANSSVQLLMKQDSSTIDAVAKTFRLSTSERQYLLGCHKGEGLLFTRGAHVGLRIGANPIEHALATTDPRELASQDGDGALDALSHGRSDTAPTDETGSLRSVSAARNKDAQQGVNGRRASSAHRSRESGREAEP